MKKTVKDFMIQDPVCIENEASINSLNRLINVKGYSHIPVLEHGELVGIVSKTDLMSRFLMMLEQTSGKTYTNLVMKNLKVKELMTPNPVVVKETDSLDDITELLMGKEFHSLVVVNDHGKVKGIVTSYDLLSEFYQNSVLFK